MTRNSWARVIGAVALLAAMALIWQSELQLALAVGWPPQIAWAAPVALDAYLLGAVLAARDVGSAVLVSTASVLVSHAVYASPTVWASRVVAEGHLVWWAAAVFSAVPLLVAWRVHSLLGPIATTAKPKPPKAKPDIAAARPPAASVAAPVVIAADPTPPKARSELPTSQRAAAEADLARLAAGELRTLDKMMEVYGCSKRTAQRIQADARQLLAVAP